MDARIEQLQRLSSERRGVIALGGGLPDPRLFPRTALGQAFARALARPSQEALQYGWPEGIPGLRTWIAERLNARGATITAEDVIITSGAQQALAIAAELLLGSQKRMLVDAETYPAALDVFRARDAVLVSAPAAQEADCAYVIPGIGNPRSIGLSAERRAELVRRGLPLIADEAYAELRFDGVLERPLLADAREQTFHVGTFSKTLCPGLRVGYLVPPPAALQDALNAKHGSDLQAGSLAQVVLDEFLARDDFERRLARARVFYARRAEQLLHALRRHFPTWRLTEPEGGFSVYVETDESGDDTELLALATEEGVSFDPGRMFRADNASSPVALRLCYSCTSGRKLRQAMGRLERAVRTWRARSASSSRVPGVISQRKSGEAVSLPRLAEVSAARA